MNTNQILARAADGNCRVSEVLDQIAEFMEKADRQREFGEKAELGASDISDIIISLRSCADRLRSRRG